MGREFWVEAASTSFISRFCSSYAALPGLKFSVLGFVDYRVERFRLYILQALGGCDSPQRPVEPMAVPVPSFPQRSFPSEDPGLASYVIGRAHVPYYYLLGLF